MRGLGGHGTLGLDIVLSVVLGMWGGNWVDERLGRSSTFIWVGFLLGVGAGVRSIQKAVSSMRRETLQEEAREGNPSPAFETELDRETRRRDAEKNARWAAELPEASNEGASPQDPEAEDASKETRDD